WRRLRVRSPRECQRRSNTEARCRPKAVHSSLIPTSPQWQLMCGHSDTKVVTDFGPIEWFVIQRTCDHELRRLAPAPFALRRPRGRRMSYDIFRSTVLGLRRFTMERGEIGRASCRERV